MVANGILRHCAQQVAQIGRLKIGEPCAREELLSRSEKRQSVPREAVIVYARQETASVILAAVESETAPFQQVNQLIDCSVGFCVSD